MPHQGVLSKSRGSSSQQPAEAGVTLSVFLDLEVSSKRLSTSIRTREVRSHKRTCLKQRAGPKQPLWPPAEVLRSLVGQFGWERVAGRTLRLLTAVEGGGNCPVCCEVGLFLISIFHVRKLRLIEAKVIQLLKIQPGPSIPSLGSFLLKKSLSF